MATTPALPEEPTSTEPVDDFGLTPDELAALGQPDPDEDDSDAPAPAPPAEPTSDASATPEPVSPDAAGQPAAPPPGTSPAPKDTAASPDTTETPTVLRADRRDLAIPGVVKLADGSVKVPAASLPALQAHLADRSVWQSQAAAFQQRIRALEAQADPAKNDAVIRANALVQTMKELRQRDETGQALYDWITGFFDHLPRYEAEAKAQALEARLQAAQAQLQPQQDAAEWAQLEPGFRDALDHHLDEALRRPEFLALAQDRDRLADSLWELRRHLFRPATPEEQRQYGVSGYVTDPTLFYRELQREAALAQRWAERTQAQTIQARNQQALGGPKPAPPAVSTRTSTPASAGAPARPKDRQAWLERLEQVVQTPD